ncbi:MAG: hypothetical protein HOC91_16225 [Nitrospinaceae bacterium]|nr:hypothetical protein [Nitrospinaceae bacterium]MBT4432057.1 hypothetical protein [Nitrospinaceae bacterium]MBT5368539.1 hypothetical protein [Nitrospinaceae bacterium]MBT5949145.1 hypothetical protein [Nitrospinaceae bacterium]
MRRFAAALLVITLGLFAVSFVEAAAKDTVTIALSGEPPTMDPHRTSNFVGTMVWRWPYDTLLSRETGTGKMIPWLAEKYELLDGTKKMKFWLRKDANFEDGSPVTSQSVAWSLSRVLKAARQKRYFASFDRIEVIDDKTFIWHNKTYDNGTLSRITRWAGVMSLKAKGKKKAHLSRNTYGSGPYKLKSWTKGNKMVFVENKRWWGKKLYPNMPKTVILRRIKEAATRVKSLEAGEVDVAWGVLPQYVTALQKNPKTKVKAVPAVRIMFLSFFSKHGGPMANQKVRLAINYAIDDALIRKTILGGRADPIGGLLHPWNFSGYNPKRKWWGHDLDKAKALMKEAGFASGFKAELIATNGRYPGDKPTCEAIAGMLKNINIKATCNSQRFPLFKKMHRAYQAGKRKGAAMYYMGFGNGGGEPGLLFSGTSMCGGSWSGHCIKELDDQVKKANATPEPKAQHAEYDKATGIQKRLATHKVVAKIHDVLGYSNRINFTPRHDETLYPWEISMKAMN